MFFSSQGNDYFKHGDYGNAIECYTKGAELDPTNPLLPANRAMALLKQEKLVSLLHVTLEFNRFGAFYSIITCYPQLFR